jgi:uncharacterized damage-inducible protein DinB
MQSISGNAEHGRSESSSAVGSAMTCQQLIGALSGQLSALSGVIQKLTDEQYAGAAGASASSVSSSIGSHVRHSLDHVAAVACGSDCLDYDTRQRGTDVERSRSSARKRIDELNAELSKLSSADAARVVRFAAVIDVDGPRVELESTLGRELAFVISHTVHHHAMITAAAKLAGVALPERFGWAPSTIRAAERTACAR